MSEQVIRPISHAIDATVIVPGSKSITNRALLLAALAEGRSRLEGVLFSEDTEAFAAALIELGLRLNIDREKCRIEIEGGGGAFPNSNAAKIYCKDAGTATRFLIPVCAAIAGHYHFSATSRMSERPIQPLLEVLQQQGSQFQFESSPYRMPFTLSTNGLEGGKVIIDITDSSQFLSGLLMASPYAKAPLILSSSLGLDHKTYVHMTLQMMAEFGLRANWLDAKTLSVPEGTYQARDYRIEPDASTASYFFVMAALTAGRMHVPNLSRKCMQGDIQFLAVLEEMGCTVLEENGGITVVGAKHLKGLGDIDMTGFSDTFMTLACLAPFADSPTTIHGLAHTRLQESDRVAAISDGLTRLGLTVSSTQDSLTIYPGQASGAAVESFKDHRIAMSLSLIGLKIPGVIIKGSEYVAKTCPNYFTLVEQVSE
ncbi:MAG: 3-phosphoshikimate 1-carboxyvinyltransferase [Gammaproteobacteria bacterium]|nr:3-phosphoshikimate 1-carboxyvinyltransferase [Gammaproteobacteria bacterium]